MNIKEAKEEIKHTLQAYNRKEENGYPLVPLRQRPILLIGPPGIGKTAIMEQVAENASVGLVAYTITHHTRQSAVGLPRIVTDGATRKEVSMTEYTMSEIIASVYDVYGTNRKKREFYLWMRSTVYQRHLRLPCCSFFRTRPSETRSVQPGWLIVAAGNPPEYNKSVREFDIVTLDRVRKMDRGRSRCLDGICGEKGDPRINPGLSRHEKGSFLFCGEYSGREILCDSKRSEDLSEILKAYEELGVEITERN